jgi:hypothetical protein
MVLLAAETAATALTGTATAIDSNAASNPDRLDLAPAIALPQKSFITALPPDVRQGFALR